jgi:hypothetical protein
MVGADDAYRLEASQVQPPQAGGAGRSWNPERRTSLKPVAFDAGTV